MDGRYFRTALRTAQSSEANLTWIIRHIAQHAVRRIAIANSRGVVSQGTGRTAVYNSLYDARRKSLSGQKSPPRTKEACRAQHSRSLPLCRNDPRVRVRHWLDVAYFQLFHSVCRFIPLSGPPNTVMQEFTWKDLSCDRQHGRNWQTNCFEAC